MSTMKLFVWEEVLISYIDSGIMFAVANNADEAREILLAKDRYLPDHDLSKEPTVLDLTKQSAFIVWGGD